MSRYTIDDLRQMYLELSLPELGRLAHQRALAMHPEPYRTYVVDRNINYANYCTARCIFCNFKADPPGMNSGRKDLPHGYVLTYQQIGQKIEELLDIGGTQILMQGGLVPGAMLPLEWYEELLRFIRREYPGVHIHAFSPPEIWGLANEFGTTIRDVLVRLRDAGLATVPGGGGEILSDRVRQKIGLDKGLSADWLEVMRQCHRLGMMTSCTMMFGHIETLDERLIHLQQLRDLQDESLAAGVPNGVGGVSSANSPNSPNSGGSGGSGGSFTAYICWTFQPDGTPLGRVKPRPAEDLTSHDPLRRLPDGKHLQLADAHEYLRMLALSRLFLDNIPHVQSSWVTQGPKIGQLALFFGANDMGSVMMEENVVSAAGATYKLAEGDIRRLISDAGWSPQQRDQYYRPIDTSELRQARQARQARTAPEPAQKRLPLPVLANV